MKKLLLTLTAALFSITAFAGEFPDISVAELKKAIGSWLQDRVMFGCDFPVLRHAKLIADWNSLGFTEEVLAKVLHRNAEAYFGLEETPR